MLNPTAESRQLKKRSQSCAATASQRVSKSPALSHPRNPRAAIARRIVGGIGLFVGAGIVVPARIGAAQANQALDLFAAVEALALDALTKAAQKATADVGVER